MRPKPLRLGKLPGWLVSYMPLARGFPRLLRAASKASRGQDSRSSSQSKRVGTLRGPKISPKSIVKIDKSYRAKCDHRLSTLGGPRYVSCARRALRCVGGSSGLDDEACAMARAMQLLLPGADGKPGPALRPAFAAAAIKEVTRTVNGTGHTGPSEFCATSI